MAIKRNKDIKIRLTEEEIEALNELVSKTGLSREEYIRTLIKGRTPVELPDKYCRDAAYQLKRLGYTMNRIAYEAHVKNFVDKKLYQRTADLVVKVATELSKIPLYIEERKNNNGAL